MKYLAFFLLLVTGTLFAQPNYQNYDAFLKKYVSASGNVSYKKIKKSDVESVVKEFQAATPQKNWSKNEQLAYWLNAYNLFTISLIVNNYPVKKITDLDNSKPWDVKRIDLGGQKYSLNDIENVIIRPTFKDARIHFAINCAAKSCPPLLNTAFTANNVQTLLEQRTKAFITSKSNLLTEKNIKISKIFDWYKADFSDLTGFLNKYSTAKIAKDAKVEYNDYDWNLNE
jgi:Protein of unknown function, DUF547